jgi:hypothetical protein
MVLRIESDIDSGPRDSDFKSNQDDEEGTESSSVQTLSTDEIIQQAKDAGFTIQDLHQAKDNT